MKRYELWCPICNANAQPNHSPQPKGEWVRYDAAAHILHRSYLNAENAYQRGIEEGERREREAQNQTYWADALNREGAAK